MKKLTLATIASLVVLAVSPIMFSLNATAADKDEVNSVATLRDSTPIDVQVEPKPIPRVVNKDIKQSRSYPMQPPVIPHTTRGYEVNLYNNKCMSCHSRQRTEESQAPMVSVTHYMNRDGNFLAEMSPRRYFCNQCHVTQVDAEPLVENTFTDMHRLMSNKNSAKDKH